MTESEVLEKFEKRFNKSLPLDSVNVIIIMDNQLANGGVEEFQDY